MDLDLTWLLWGLPLAFVLGWVASRLDLRQWRLESRQAPKAFFRGLNHLLNEQQDRAIDAFIEAVQNDPDTSELHFALGNLFRRRGDYDRAVRVHEHLLSRGDLGQKDRDRAQHALALDFLKAGLLDRAETALQRLQGTSFEAEANLALLGIYERARDWPLATAMAQRLESAQRGSFGPRIAHFLCEQAAQTKDPAQALGLLEQAMEAAPAAARARFELAQWHQQQGQPAQALDTLIELAHKAPQALPLIAHPMVVLAKTCQRETEVKAVLEALQASPPSLDVTEGLAALSPDPDTARGRYLDHLRQEPSLVVAARWLQDEPLGTPEHKALVQKALDQAATPLKRYRCAACGFEAKQYFWQCPGCQTWDSYPTRRVEEL